MFHISNFIRFNRGKFSQRADLPQTSIFNSPEKMYELLNNPSVEVTEIIQINEEMILMNWRNHPEELPESPFTSVAVASYVTAQARLYLYSFMEKLQNRLIYCDTDSVFFFDGPGDSSLDTGDFLGQLTDELDKWPNSYISEFVCGKICQNVFSSRNFIVGLPLNNGFFV